MKESIYVFWFSVCLIVTQLQMVMDAVNILESAQLLAVYCFSNFNFFQIVRVMSQ